MLPPACLGPCTTLGLRATRGSAAPAALGLLGRRELCPLLGGGRTRVLFHEGFIDLKASELVSCRRGVFMALQLGGVATCHAVFSGAPIEKEGPALAIDGAFEVSGNFRDIIDSAAGVEFLLWN